MCTFIQEDFEAIYVGNELATPKGTIAKNQVVAVGELPHYDFVLVQGLFSLNNDFYIFGKALVFAESKRWVLEDDTEAACFSTKLFLGKPFYSRSGDVFTIFDPPAIIVWKAMP